VTTLGIIEVIVRIAWLTTLSAPAAISIEPTRTIPWIAFAPDISGVCSVAGTLLMTSNPTRIASTKIVIAESSSGLMAGPPKAPASRPAQEPRRPARAP